MDIYTVVLAKNAERALKKTPTHIVHKFQVWLDLVETEGLREARKIKSFHDEPLKGPRQGQRSIRLNKAYRAIYVEIQDKHIELVEVLEVNKHDY